MLCKSCVKAIVIVKWRATISLMLVDDVDLTQITRKNSRWFESHNCSSREIIMHDKSSRTCRRDALDAFYIARWRGVESSPASGRIFGIDSFSTIFVPFFRAVVHARSRVETAAKNCYSRGRLLSQRAFARGRGKRVRVENLLSHATPQGVKMMFAPIRELRAISRGRVTASLLDTSDSDPSHRLVSALFSRYSDLILHARCE